MWNIKDMNNHRSATAALLDMVDQGLVDPHSLINDFLAWMSEHEVSEFARDNGYFIDSK